MMNEQQVQPLRSPLAQGEIESIWIAAAGAMGWTVTRQPSAYASSDGSGHLVIGLDEILDANDAVAQLIFHELCHALVEGPARWSLPDWGLSNADDRDVMHEHACLRVQVHLTERHGLRELMAPTTEYRSYHDEISGDALNNDNDPAASLARGAIERAETSTWIELLGAALADTRAVLDASAVRQPAGEVPAALHPVGFAFASQHRDQSCGNCAWRYRGGRGRPVERCRQSAGHDGVGRRTSSDYRACERWEPVVDCQTCGACCREAYHSVTISVRDPVVWKHPELVVRNGHRFEILRAGERCAALAARGGSPDRAWMSEELRPQGVEEEEYLAVLRRPATQRTGPAAIHATRSDFHRGLPAQEGAPDSAPNAATSAPPPTAPAFACRIYEDRPRPCREFEAGGRHCLVARRRVRLSP